jgi:hypothetical protein
VTVYLDSVTQNAADITGVLFFYEQRSVEKLLKLYIDQENNQFLLDLTAAPATDNYTFLERVEFVLSLLTEARIYVDYFSNTVEFNIPPRNFDLQLEKRLIHFYNFYFRIIHYLKELMVKHQTEFSD